jgi:predicted AAA+ superfamily ATPase
MPHINRHIQAELIKSLNVMPAIFINGPRQAGKSTLVQKIAESDYPASYVTFDNTTQMAAAAHAPENYLRSHQGPIVIDEAQLVPEIFRAMKLIIDQMRINGEVKGRFLLTGSANIMALPALADPLVGRVAIHTLYPISGAEALSGKGDFITRLFAQEFKATQSTLELNQVIRQATFPEIAHKKAQDQSHWFDGYLTTIIQRDVRALADIEKLSVIPNLLRILATRAGGLINDADVARNAGLNTVTTRNYKTLLRMLFLTFDIPPWYRNLGKRFVKASKGYLIDSLLLCHLLQYNLDDLISQQPERFGHVLENFVATELIKLMANNQEHINLCHFRTSDHYEVDFVLEKPSGHIAGIEVKQSDHLTAADFKGLKMLAKLTGNDFICGVVLYGGSDVVPFGQNLWAVPISHLWS